LKAVDLQEIKIYVYWRYEKFRPLIKVDMQSCQVIKAPKSPRIRAWCVEQGEVGKGVIAVKPCYLRYLCSHVT